ncbi:3-hydroxybutyryl-CoA dehydratase [Rhodococcus sp. WS4]|nr:3-hydroxybutyryl-CoA dehydratase [Rhodococcus sp. WS4]
MNFQQVDRPVRVEIDDAVWTLELSRPERRNAIDLVMIDQLHEALDRIEHATVAPRAVVLTGAGGSFCSGADLKARSGMAPEDRAAHASRIAQSAARIAHLAMPTIAVVDGFALGAGCELSLACDIRIATDRAVFGLPETAVGVIPGAGGTQRLTRLVGPARAKEMIFWGLRVSGAEAERAGLAQRFCPSADAAAEELKNLLDGLASRAPLAIAAAKRAIDVGIELPLDEALRLESELVAPLFGTHDYQEGVDAFAERRPPRFRGY